MKLIWIFAIPALCLCRVVSAVPISHFGQTVFEAPKGGAETVIKGLKEAQVIPDVLPEDFQPSYALAVAYPSEHEEVLLGNTIPVKATSSRPVFQISPFSTTESLSPTKTLTDNGTLTLVLTDPDATSMANPTKGQMCHWIATGITINKVNETEAMERGEGSTYALDMRPSGDRVCIDAVKELVEYMAPAPPKKTGKHRYIFVLLEPSAGDSKRNLKKPQSRSRWGYEKRGSGVMEWARDNDLSPVAANFFYAQHKKQ